MAVDLERLEALRFEQGLEYTALVTDAIAELRAARERIAELETVASEALLSIETFEKLRMPDWNGSVDPDSLLGRLRTALSSDALTITQPRVTDEAVEAALDKWFAGCIPSDEYPEYFPDMRAALKAAMKVMK